MYLQHCSRTVQLKCLCVCGVFYRGSTVHKGYF